MLNHTPPYHLRQKWYFAVNKYHQSVSKTCKLFGISRKTYYKWRKRDFGLPREYHSPAIQPQTKLTHQIKVFIEKTKRTYNFGPLKMKYLLKHHFNLDCSSTIIYRYYKRKGLIFRPTKKRLPYFKPIKHRIKANCPLNLVQMDIKYVHGPQGERMYQYSVIDVFTQKIYFKIFRNKNSLNAIKTIQEAEQYFNGTILAIQTDNGSEFRGEFHAWVTGYGKKHYFIPKGSPYWNGRVERLHRTIDDEYYLNPRRPWPDVFSWMEWYNTERPHLSLKGLTPEQCYQLNLDKSVTPRC